MSALQTLERLLKEGKISRRNFLSRVSALGMMAAVSPLLLSHTAHGATPKRGGRLRLGLAGGSTTDSLDPATITDMMMQVISQGQIRNCLVEIDQNTQPIPELAEGWEPTPDAKKWIFKLRKGVEFHNGKTMDADDVIFSINHHRGKDTKSAAKGIVDQIADIKKDGPYTVIFLLKGGNADFPFILSDYHLTISPAGSNFIDGVGTGGYILKEFEPGVRAFAVRNPNYFKTDRAWFDEVETLGIADVNARTNALKSGQIDVMNRCELKTVHLLRRTKGIQVMQQNGFKHYTYAMRCDIPPYDNNHVRLALKYAIDREQMVKTILRGYGTVGNDHPISTANRYHASELKQRRFDPERAKFHLKKAGVGNITFNLSVAEAAYVGAVDAGVLYRESATRAGINIKVVREPNDGYWSNVWMKKPWCAVFWGGRPTEDMMFSTAYAADAAWNDTFWKNPRFNELLVAARAELDEKKRRQMYVEMQALVRDDGGVVVPMFAADLSAATDKIGHGKLGVNWELDGFRCAERWWFV
ncbi:MAG: ABC transporter substrate-binding protein [Deltaproteobacteria bacterium]|nr:ABC transporter substrate-binding protein [Deltaproteobacteria bacterium]MBW1961008.1 ABC transporter substrate-binding protein [Deltaproteobacteria bacterium]MBW1992933.1 ABC transporter substrate-binding protein [Deltaproteobacteria bacterium]MBW2152775.1 ABC transporter substrate-binding protein [Deltaproteobacteria bacterium]